jgi:RNA polymerase sigma-70 factor (ECF subfamily)
VAARIADALTTQSAGDSDEVLVRRVLAGDHRAFEQVMRRYNRRLFRLARATLREDSEAEDALQEAYLAAYRSLARFRGDASLATWLSRLVLNECLGRRRRSARRERIAPTIASAEDGKEVLEMSIADTEAPDFIAMRDQVRALLERKLDELPDDFRAVFMLRSVEELSVEETAECLGLPEATVRSRHFRARGLLRAALSGALDSAERTMFEFAGARCDRIVANVLQRVGGATAGP